jgi:hypothetical protein
MIWSCMTSRGVNYASQVLQKTMDSDCYIEILGTSFKDTLCHELPRLESKSQSKYQIQEQR